MRILVANDGLSDLGGVQGYLEAVFPALQSRGHALAMAYCSDRGAENGLGLPPGILGFPVGSGERDPFSAVRRWAPDVCYSHNMNEVAVDRQLIGIAPTVKFMHGYFGTCISGLKSHAFPALVPCDRIYGPACLALYFPRRCGRLSPGVLLANWRVAEAQHAVQDEFAAIVVASGHMQREYVRNGADPARVHVNPLFPTHRLRADSTPVAEPPQVAFLGRMTPLKGGDLLIRAAAHAAARLGRPVRLTMIGDGPQRADWEVLARKLGVPCTFTGWISGDDRWPLVRAASVVALPSVWPEPFGLVGLEAGALGVPAIAVNVGGISEWLKDGVNGVAVGAPSSADGFGDALASLLRDAGRLSVLRTGALRIAGEMSVDRHVDRLESIFQTATAAPALC